MSADELSDDAIARAVRAIAEGDALPPWTGSPGDPAMDQLRVLERVARCHRAAADPKVSDATIGSAPPPSAGPVISTWTHFHLLERIGAGASGEVYRAWDGHMARAVALKLRVVADDEPAPMVTEARRLGRVRHPNFVTVHGTARAEGHVGTWMELLSGPTLQDLVGTFGPLSAREAALVAADVCSALAAVHRVGLLHRDIKPQNVIREHAGRIVLLDLSASRDSDQATTDLAGTPLYLAPELFHGVPATVASDIYAMGALLFFLTTGTTPVGAATIGDLRAAHERRAARSLRDLRPDLPRGFVDIVERATAARPEDRFASAGALEAALSTLLAQRDGSSREPKRWPIWSRHVPVGVTALLVLVGALGASIATTLLGHRPAIAPPPVEPLNQMRVISADQLKIARAIEDLAASYAERGEWRSALTQYQEAEQVYRVNTSADAPLVARAVLHVAWTQHQLGDLDAATPQYELAIAKLREFDLQPMMTAAQVALAGVHQQAGRLDAMAVALSEGLDARARTLGLASKDGATGTARLGLASTRLIASSARHDVLDDRDQDGLPDLIETALGLDAGSRDSDRDGETDGREDHDGDGLSNDLEFGLPLDPTALVAHYGSNDPEWLGFQQPSNRRISGRRLTNAGEPAWRVEALGYTQFFWPLSKALRARALARGWRLSTRGVAGAGRAYTNLDFGPEGPRFDLDFEQHADGFWRLQRNTSVVPYAGIQDRISDSADWGVIELVYDPDAGSAELIVNGRPASTERLSGHLQFREQLGLAFGSSQLASSSTPGNAEFRLVMLTIR